MRESHPQAEINFSALARAGEGLTQWRPLLMGFLTLLLACALAGLGVWAIVRMQNVTGSLLGLLLNLVAIVVVLAGTSGVGAMLMDRAQRAPVRGYLDAGIFGLMCIPKFLGFGLVIALAGLAFFLVAALVYFICKIPVLGAVLAFVAHPLLIMVGSALLVALLFVVNPLFAPAVWSGLSMKDALISVIGIASQRLVPVVLMQLMLYGVVGMTGWLLTAGLLPVGLSLTGMAAAIMADGEGMMSMAGSFGGGYGGYGGYGGGYGGYGPMGMLGGLMENGSLIGMVLGLIVLLVVLTALMAQVMILGLNLVYLQAQENLDTSDTSSRFNRWLATVVERSKAAAQAAKEKARKVKEQADQKALEIKAANEERRLERERQAAEKAEQDRIERERQAEENAKQDALDRQAAEQAERERIERERVESEKAAAAAAERERQQEAERKAQAEAQRVQEDQARRAAEEEKRLRAEADAKAKAKAQADAQAAAAAQAKFVAAPSCPACHSAVGADDAFCGECGHKLK